MTACTPGTAVAETCNNIDDDCDGTVDDGVTRPTSLRCWGLRLHGYGDLHAGVWGGDTCVAGTPGTEVCNNIDDDCDGTVDDGLTFVTYYRDADNDGYGNADNATATCDGAPAGYVDNSTGFDCRDNNSAVNPGATEVCNNIDDNCDGNTDEDLTRGSTCGVGACASTGTETCSAGAWGGNTCTPGTPGVETCNNIDDDCDGTVDDGLTRPTNCGVGACASTGTETCTAGAWGSNTCTAGTPGK